MEGASEHVRPIARLHSNTKGQAHGWSQNLRLQKHGQANLSEHASQRTGAQQQAISTTPDEHTPPQDVCESPISKSTGGCNLGKFLLSCIVKVRRGADLKLDDRRLGERR